MSNITLDIKIQDELRKWFSQRGSQNNLQITGISLGDSDIDYELSQNKEIIKSFPAPYRSYGIKHKLIYDGNINNLSGTIVTNIVKINSEGYLQSIYNYPQDSVFLSGTTKPGASTGLNFEKIPFDSASTVLEGYVVFISTLIDQYLDVNGNRERYLESYKITFSSNNNDNDVSYEMILDSEGKISNSLYPNNNQTYRELILPGTVNANDQWEFIYDTTNNSFVFIKNKNYVSQNIEKFITITGRTTGIIKKLIFTT